MDVVLLQASPGIILDANILLIILMALASLYLVIKYREQTKNVALFSLACLLVGLWYFFYPNTLNKIIEVSEITTNSGYVIGKNRLNAVIFAENIIDIQFYCIYRVSVRGNRINENIGVKIKGKEFIFFPARNRCNYFFTKLKSVGVKLNYEEDINFPQINQNALTQGLIQWGFFLGGLVIVFLINRDRNRKISNLNSVP